METIEVEIFDFKQRWEVKIPNMRTFDFRKECL